MTGLPIREVEKPWGVDVLPAPFAAPAGQRIGEVWFEPPPQLCSLLVKYIFTSEKLSVQVHPSDAQASAAGETDAGTCCGNGRRIRCGAAVGRAFPQRQQREDCRIETPSGELVTTTCEQQRGE